MTQLRNDSNGQFGFVGQWDRLCVCGHPLGTHTGQPPHECVNEDTHIPAPYAGTGEPCDCKKFRASKRKN